MTRHEAHAILAAFDGDVRRAKLETHPDHGGSATSFKQVTKAIEVLGV